MEKLEPARLEFNAVGEPYSPTFDDVYHSAYGGPAQSRHVFLSGNELPQRWQGKHRFVILETGFGFGLNFLAAWQAWREDPQRCQRLHFVSFEKHPFSASDLLVAHARWPEFGDLSAQLLEHWPALTPGVHRLYLNEGQVILTLIFGDAASQLRAVNAAVDVFFLDGFSPTKNPALWSPYFCKGLSRLAAPGATLATWTVAGEVREALSAAEFEVKKVQGFTGKRQMLIGQFRSQRPNRHPAPEDRRAIVIGAGLAGCSTAHRLAAAGWQVTVLEQANAPAMGASGNLAGMLRPLPSADDNRLSRLTRAGFLATRKLLDALPGVCWSSCGVLHLARESEHEAQQRRTVESLGFPPDLMQFVDHQVASGKLKWPVEHGGWWFPEAGWVQPASFCRSLLESFPEHITVRCNVAVDRLEHSENSWQALGADGQTLAEAPVLIMASGVAAPRFAQFNWLPQVSARGQVSHLPVAESPVLDIVVCKLGYATPAVDGYQLAGATLAYEDDGAEERVADHRENLAKLNLILPGFAKAIAPETLSGRVGFRPMSPDRLPIVGRVPFIIEADNNTRLHEIPRQRGLWCVQGFGARGIVWSALMADLLVSQLEGEPLPLENDLVDAIDPARFLVKGARRATVESDAS